MASPNLISVTDMVHRINDDALSHGGVYAERLLAHPDQIEAWMKWFKDRSGGLRLTHLLTLELVPEDCAEPVL